MVSSCRVIPCLISDHSAVLANLNISVPRAETQSKQARRIRNISIPEFRIALEQELQHFPSLPQSSSVDDTWHDWHSRFMTVLDRYAPMKTVPPRRKPLPPWSDRETYHLIRARNRLHTRWLRNPEDMALHRAFKLARTQASNAIRRKRNSYSHQTCQCASANPRKLWQLINSLTGRTRAQPDPTCDVEEVGNTFHQVVTDANRPPILAEPQGPLRGEVLSDFRGSDAGSVYELLRKVDARKATGSDGVPGSLLLATADIIAPSLTQLFNMSLKSGIVPRAFKLAEVRPLFQSGDPASPGNYRPVSLLPIISKILERIVQNQLQGQLSRVHALPDTQFAYRHGYSTEDALVVLTDTLLEARDRRQVSGVCFLDLSKAFDKVSHERLIQDLFALGVTGRPLRWLISYLSERTQRVCFGASSSTITSCSWGVPQGSVLGALLFNVYTRDVPQVAQSAATIQFADDVAVCCSADTTQAVASTLSTAVSSWAEWLEERGLILNEKKSQVLTVFPGRDAGPRVTVLCRSQALPTVTSAKYLGVIIDEGLNFQQHLKAITAKVSRKVGALWRTRRCLSLAARVTYLKSVVMPDLTYASSCFVFCLTAQQATDLQTLENKAVRAVFGTRPYDSAQPLLQRVELYRISELHKQKALLLTWRCIHGIAGNRLCGLISRSPDRRTRLQKDIGAHVPPAASRAGQARFSVAAPKLWNALPSDIRTIPQRSVFKMSVIPHTLAP